MEHMKIQKRVARVLDWGCSGSWIGVQVAFCSQDSLTALGGFSTGQLQFILKQRAALARLEWELCPGCMLQGALEGWLNVSDRWLLFCQQSWKHVFGRV